VADAIAGTLRDEGLSVDVREAQEVVSLTGYRAVGLGAPLYLERWHEDARLFLERHRQVLPELPVAVFALGPVGNDKELIEKWRGALLKTLANYPWLSPIAAEMFGGKYDPAKLEEFHHQIAELPASPLRGMEASDLRDWDAIAAWARGIAGMLGPERAPGRDEAHRS